MTPLSPDERRRPRAATRTTDAATRVNAEARRQYEAFVEGAPDTASWEQISRECADTWRAAAVESLAR